MAQGFPHMFGKFQDAISATGTQRDAADAATESGRFWGQGQPGDRLWRVLFKQFSQGTGFGFYTDDISSANMFISEKW